MSLISVTTGTGPTAMTVTHDLGKLHFDSINFAQLKDGINPRFKCPVCSRVWSPKLALGTTFPATFDFNKKVTVTAPNHTYLDSTVACPVSGKQISWFVAVHRDVNGIRFCIQKSSEEGAGGIPVNWWVRPT